jgi:hypothetical protein
MNSIFKIKSGIIILFIILSSASQLYSQKDICPINYRFKNGEDGFISFFSENLETPKNGIDEFFIGNSITRVSINSKGEINQIETINSLDSILDTEVRRVINLTRPYWNKCDTIYVDQVFYIQIAFCRSRYQPILLIPKSMPIKKLFPKPILFILEDEPKKPFTKSEDIGAQANLALAEGRLEDAGLLCNELIKRNPFNRELYKVRIMINIKLNRPDLVSQDDNKIYNFAEGYSIDELTNNKKD